MMSTQVYSSELYGEIYKKDHLYEQILFQSDSVKRQIDNGCEKIEIHILGLVIHAEYDDGELCVVA